MHEADQPDLVGDLSYSHHLAGEHDAEIDLALALTDTPTTSDAYDLVVIRVFRLLGWLVGVS